MTIIQDDLNELAESLRTKHKEELDERIKFFEPLSSFKYKWLVKMESEPTYHLAVGNNAEQAMSIANGEFKLKVVMETWDADKKEYVLVDKPSIHSVEITSMNIKATEATVIGVTKEFKEVLSIPGSASKKKTSTIKE